MTPTRCQIEGLVLRIQGEFLDTPALRLSIPHAAQHFGLDGVVCDAVLGALADARVLTIAPDGAYERFYPGRRPVPQLCRWHAT